MEIFAPHSTKDIAVEEIGLKTSDQEGTGLEVIDLKGDPTFASRRLHVRDIAAQMHGMQRLSHAFVESPTTVLQELVNAAVELCGADSAGISIETEEKIDENYYSWVATAGEYAGFNGASLPREPSACGICLERGQPQLFRVSQRFFDLMGIEAPVVTDGLLLPWEVDETRGTIWIMAHGRTEAFDASDCNMMQTLADFAAMAVRSQKQHLAQMNQVAAQAASAMANQLAHQINNPLQALTNVAYLAAEGQSGSDTRSLGQEFSADLKRLSLLVNKLLVRPRHESA